MKPIMMEGRPYIWQHLKGICNQLNSFSIMVLLLIQRIDGEIRLLIILLEKNISLSLMYCPPKKRVRSDGGSGSIEEDIASEDSTSAETSGGSYPPQVSHYPR